MQRILLAVKPRLLCDALRSRIDDQGDMIVVGTIDEDLDLLAAVRAYEANVIIHSWNYPFPPAMYTHLLHEFPGLKVFGIGPENNQAVLCEQRITYIPFEVAHPADLLMTLRNAVTSPSIHV